MNAFPESHFAMLLDLSIGKLLNEGEMLSLFSAVIWCNAIMQQLVLNLV